MYSGSTVFTVTHTAGDRRTISMTHNARGTVEPTYWSCAPQLCTHMLHKVNSVSCGTWRVVTDVEGYLKCNLFLKCRILKNKKIIIIHSLFCEVSPKRMIHLHFADTMKEFVEIKDVLNRCDSCSISVMMECECNCNT